jgi:hypothetical protein
MYKRAEWKGYRLLQNKKVKGLPPKRDNPGYMPLVLFGLLIYYTNPSLMNWPINQLG